MPASNTSDSSERAGYIAGNHFGLGLRPGELRYINSDPRGWLKSQLDNIENLPASLQAQRDKNLTDNKIFQQHTSLRLQAAANVASQDRGSDRPALEGPI